MEMIATAGDSYMYSDHGILLSTKVSAVADVSLFLGCAQCLAPHAHHWIQCLIPTVAMGVTVTGIVTVNSGTIPEGIEGCKCMQGIAGHGLQDTGPWHPGHWDSNNVTIFCRMTEFHVQHP